MDDLVGFPIFLATPTLTFPIGGLSIKWWSLQTFDTNVRAVQFVMLCVTLMYDFWPWCICFLCFFLMDTVNTIYSAVWWFIQCFIIISSMLWHSVCLHCENLQSSDLALSHHQWQRYTTPKFNIAPAKLPSQKETSIPTIHFQMRAVGSGRVVINIMVDHYFLGWISVVFGTSYDLHQI